MQNGFGGRAAPWLVLAGILALFLVYLAWLQPAVYFGFFRDDALYFGSAQTLAAGRGFLLANFPGAPPQTRVPVLLPWLLSWIWKFQPAFPTNAATAARVTEFFACGFLLAAFVFLRKLKGVGTWAALLVVALCALQPSFDLFSGQVLSDVPFAALALFAAILADRAMRANGRFGWALAAGVLTGLCILMRTQGVAVLAGILVAGCVRRTFRQTALYALSAAPFLIPIYAQMHRGAAFLASTGNAAELPGYRQTMLFYMSYGGFWRFCVPRLEVFFQMIWQNGLSLLRYPGTSALMRFNPGSTKLEVISEVALTLMAVAGIIRQARAQEFKPIHFIFPFLALISVVWNYPHMARFLALYLPLIFAGIWIEGKRLTSIIRGAFGAGKPAGEKIIALGLAAVMAGFIVLAGHDLLSRSLPALRAQQAERTTAMQAKREAYEWVRTHTDRETKFVASEDGLFYLYTGREAVRPIAFSTEGFVSGEARIWERDIARLTDTARGVHARYWMMAPDDFEFEAGWPMMRSALTKRVAELEEALPIVFRSRDGSARIHDLKCLQEPQRPDCGQVAPVPPTPGLPRN